MVLSFMQIIYEKLTFPYIFNESHDKMFLKFLIIA